MRKRGHMANTLMQDLLSRSAFCSRLVATTGVIFTLSAGTCFAAYDNYRNDQQSSRSSTVYYPPEVRSGGGSKPSIVSVTNTRTGAHVVLGGTVVPYREVTLTAQLPGRVEFLAGEEGDWFEEGQVIVAVDDDDVMAQRRQALAQLYGTQSALGDSRVTYSREYWSPQSYKDYNKKLLGSLPQPQAQPQAQTAPSMGYFPNMFDRFFGMGGSGMPGGATSAPAQTSPSMSSIYPSYDLHPWVVRDLDLYSQGTRVSQAQSQMYGVRSKIEEIDTHIRDAKSVSPFEGVIVEKMIEVGDTVQPGQALVKYADTRYLQLKVEVPARLVSALSKDIVVPAKLDVGDTYIDVRVAQIYPTADSQRHTVTVKFDLPSGVPGGPGMYAEVMIPDVNTPVKDMPIIPSSSIVRRGSLPAVYVLNRSNEAELRLVRLGEQVDRDHVAVLSGVRPGEQVFANPPTTIRSGWSPSSSKRKKKESSDD